MLMDKLLLHSTPLDVVDTTNSSDDFSSNGLIVWDPQSEIIGAATIVIDLSLTPVDLIRPIRCYNSNSN